jgi:CubicO group peptidase (beta-lactamase class C family)
MVGDNRRVLAIVKLKIDRNTFMRTLWFAAAAAVGLVISCSTAPAADALSRDWSRQQIDKLPKSESAVMLFNGRNLDGWEGQKEKYWSVQDGVIVGKNGEDNAPQASTYLVTKEKYRNFRLIFEAKLVTSEMHSGIALWGKTVEKMGDPYSYMGHLVMFPSGYGYYDLYRRNSIYRDTEGVAKRAGKQHDWNRMEILAIGNRIRHVINGTLVADWSDPKPELCETGPIGLQLHANKVPQEVNFRGLVLTKDPEDRLVTVAQSESNSDSKTSDIRSAMERFVADGKISGAVTLVARQGKVVHHEAIGWADIEAKRPMQRDTLFAIASMTKPITATAVMILVDEGKLSLDDPVSKHIPEFKEAALKTGTPKREITMRDLMTHTSGVVGDQQNVGTLAETAVALARRPMGFEPGAQWQYSPGLSVCGRVVEVTSGMPFEEFLAARIFVPLGMIDTSFNPAPEQQKRLARLYQPGKEGQSLAPATHWINDLSSHRSPNPSGGLFSTAADLARFYQMVLNGGELEGQRILSAKAVKEMTTIQTGELKTGFTPGNGWGLGWCVVREPQGVTKNLSPGTFGHGGAFGTQGWVDPKRQMTFVLLIQRTNFGNSDASEIRQTLHDVAVDATGK